MALLLGLGGCLPRTGEGVPRGPVCPQQLRQWLSQVTIPSELGLEPLCFSPEAWLAGSPVAPWRGCPLPLPPSRKWQLKGKSATEPRAACLPPGLRPGRLLSVPPHLRLTSEQTGSVGLTGGERERLAKKGRAGSSGACGCRATCPACGSEVCSGHAGW